MRRSAETTHRVTIPREIKVLIGCAFIIAIGFGIIAPVLPQYAQSFGVGAFAVSAVVSAFGLARLVFAPVSGRATSRFGETPVYMIGVTIVAISMFLIASAQTYWQLLVFRGLGGLGSTLFTVSAMSFLARKSPPSIRGRVSGAYASAFLIGNIAGPVVGGLLATWGPRVPFIIYGTALLVAAGLVFVLLRESRLADRRTPDTRTAMPVAEAWGHGAYRASLGSFLANGWATFGVRNSITPLFAASAFVGSGFILNGPQTAAAALAVFAAGNIVAITFSSRLSDRYGRRPLIIPGLMIAGVATAAIGFSPDAWWFLALCIAAGMGTGMLNAPQQAAIADLVGQNRKAGSVMSTAQMSSDLGAIVGPLLVGFLVDVANYELAFAITGAVLVMAGIGWLLAPETNNPVVPGGPRTGALPKITPADSGSAEQSHRDVG
ncbi:MFS transporter [Citricoccus sp. NR2]|uniref:MFS transporter n=1 Tax=Citricoccus sp. NR2 TaxID=3004095 RepID=UPI0022DCFF22|nr:MFS transporter [Citricoccus sp. NR2]WBL18558.1 MFS transporter [Citricoccus sp. NR2]